METQPRNRTNYALRVHSYMLFIAGGLLLCPFVLLLVKAMVPLAAETLLSISLLLLGAGGLVLTAPFVTIPGFGLWIQKNSDDHADVLGFYKIMFIRYAPILIIGIVQMVIATRYRAFYLTAIYALGLLVFAGRLVVIDRNHS